MASELKIKVNERLWKVAAAPDTPLLYVLANELELQGPRFGWALRRAAPVQCSHGVETVPCDFGFRGTGQVSDNARRVARVVRDTKETCKSPRIASRTTGDDRRTGSPVWRLLTA